MKELVIKSKGGKDVTTSLIVAEIFGKRHDHVLRDIENLSCSEEFRLLNFGETPYTHPQNGQTYKMFQITKNGFSFLVMGYTGEKAGEFKEKFISEFDKREALLKDDDYILLRSQEILQKRISDVEQKLNQANDTIKELEPKRLFAESVTASDTCILIGELAKILKQNGYNTGEKKLYQELREQGYLIKRYGTDHNMPTQRSMELGLFQIKETPINRSTGISVSKTPKVTGKGQVYFVNKFLNQKQTA